MSTPDIDPQPARNWPPPIGKILAEVQRWESIPNRREPFTLDMHKYIAKEAAKKQDDCCLEDAIANWTQCNLYAGCRRVEWMKTDSTNSDPISYHRNRFGNAYAFTPRDVQCATASNQLLSLSKAIASPHQVGCIRLRFEEQKMARMARRNYSSVIQRTQASVLSRTSCTSCVATILLLSQTLPTFRSACTVMPMAKTRTSRPLLSRHQCTQLLQTCSTWTQ